MITRERWKTWRLPVALIILAALVIGGGVAFSVLKDVPGELAKSYTEPVDWYDCGGGYRCGDVRVPVDWDSRETTSARVALIKHSATSGTKLGSILVNPGGPGGSGVDFVGNDVTGVVTSDVAKHFDVIGFDPRGVGYSTKVKCYSAAQMDAYLYKIIPGEIGSKEWLAADRKNARDFGAACQKNTGDLLGHIDTTSVARDMDLIRSDIGATKLNYVGYSYGTYLGTIYAGLYPSRVGRFVLDGADDPWAYGDDSGDDSGGGGGAGADDGSSGDGVVDQAKAFEGDLRAYLTACLAGSSSALRGGTCPFTGTVSSSMADVSTLLTRVGESPLTAKDGRRLGSATLATAIIEPLYSTDDWPDLTTLFTQIEAGNPAKAFSLADSYNDRTAKGKYYDNGAAVFTAVNCLEGGADDYLPDMRHQAALLKKDAPVLGIYQAYGDIQCGEWPVGPVAFPDPVTASGSGPILVVGTTGDPATPYSDAKALSKQLTHGHLVTFVGQGHTAYDKGDSCIDGVIDAYLLRGTVPARDPKCR